MGGLIGIFIGLMFILSKYNEKAYEISLAHKMFKDKNGEEVESKGFNFGYFFIMPLKSMLNYCGCGLDWTKT